MKQTMKSQLFPGPVSMAAHVRCWQSGRFNRSGWCPCQALASVSGNTESPRRRAAAGRPQDTRSHAAAAEFSGRVGSRRRNKFRIVRFRMNAKTHSLHCSSSPNRTRCVVLRFGLEPTTGTIPILHPY